MKLSQYFPETNIVRDGEFKTLGYVDSVVTDVLAFADSLKYFQRASANPNVSCLITTPELSALASDIPSLIVSDSPRSAFYDIHIRFVEESRYTLPIEAGIGSGCRIHPSAIISEGCQIGDNVIIGEQAVIREPVWIGSGVTIEPGVKVGVEGILYNRTSKGLSLIPHAGYVRIHDNVSLMTNSIVVRSIHDSDLTEVGQGALVGLASIVGHEVKIGAQAVISNQCVIARRSIIGKGAFLGTNVTIREHVSVGENARVMAGSVVIRDVAEDASVSGNFASEHKSRMLSFARMTGKHN